MSSFLFPDGAERSSAGTERTTPMSAYKYINPDFLKSVREMELSEVAPAAAGSAVESICKEWVAAGMGDECFWENWPDCPTENQLTPNMVLSAIIMSESNTAPSVGSAATCSPLSCLQCRHHRDYMTHLTATVECRYPRERVPWVVDATIFLHGNPVTPIKTADRCPHFEANVQGEARADSASPPKSPTQ